MAHLSLTDAMDTPEALFEAVGIPRQIVVHQHAGELKVQPRQVLATAKLFAEGATVPFIARYRKEATGTNTISKNRTNFRFRQWHLPKNSCFAPARRSS